MPPASEAIDGVAEARTRARQRLVGAVVLVAIGIIGFPLVFETEPRPIPVDIPIDIPRKDGMSPLAMPGNAGRAPASASAVLVEPPPLGEATDAEGRADADRDTSPASAKPSANLPPIAAQSSRSPAAGSIPAKGAASAATVEPRTAIGPAPATDGPAKTAPPATVRKAQLAEAARAEALLEGRPLPKVDAKADAKADARADAKGDSKSDARAEGKADPRLDPNADPKSEASRFIVQVGAYAEAAAARDARLKAERLGLKTYTQVAETADGSRIRVRLGPYATREDADRALAKARAAGLGGVVLVL